MYKKNLHLWLPALIRWVLSSRDTTQKPVHIIFTLVDHFEPYWKKATNDIALKRVKAWVDKLPRILSKFKDAHNYTPKHIFFYPEEQYNFQFLNMLSDICRTGFGNVEIHLHHDSDTAESLRYKLLRFKTLLYEKHGLLHMHPKTREIAYGFIHGDWALCNSRKDGRFCGVNNELSVLKETGCYADFTLPSAPSETQTRKINSIYYARDNLGIPKSHDTGIDVMVGRKPSANDLLIIQGPLTLNWKCKKLGLFPRIENGELSWNNPARPERVDLWVRQHIHIKGRPEWIFIKVHTHGAQEKNLEALLNGGLERLYSYLEEKYNDGINYILHYVSTWEMYNIIKAAEAGKTGNPSDYRDYINKS